MADLDLVVARLAAGQRFVVSSHERPDGDAIGSAMAMALALAAIGKHADVVMEAVPPAFLQPFPGVDRIHVTKAITTSYDAAIVMECSSLERTGVAGLDRSPVINIDHHPGNTRYGAINWVDESAAACGELVFTLIEALGAPLTPDVATQIYLAILTDTGSFRFSHITPRTFDIARRCVAAGANPQWIARTHYDSSTIGRVRIFGAVLNAMQLDPSGRVALLTLTQAAAAAAGGTYDDTDGLINFPLSVKDIEAVAFFKEAGPDDWRVSLRSKGDVDINAVAKAFGGGGHKNASGCSASGSFDALRRVFEQKVTAAIEKAWTESSSSTSQPA